MNKRPVVAIVGRPNVGKSTFFNSVLKERRALVHPQPGMTRDRNYGHAEYRGKPFTLIDTGGYEDSTDSRMLQQMRQQVLYAIEEADKVIFLGDVMEPDDPADQEIIQRLRQSRRPFFLAVNKCDSLERTNQAIADFSRFGIDPIYPVATLHGNGIYDLLDDVTEDFERWDPDAQRREAGRIHVAIVGRQNAGKSTLLNRLFGEERVIVNPLAGTTRDAVDAEIEVDGQAYTVIDTAGIRRRGKVEKGPEGLSVISSFNAIDRADVCLLVVDASEGIVAQDQHVAGYILERMRACVIILNKWDQVPDREKAFKRLTKEAREHFNFMPWAPVLTASALTGQRTHQVWDLVRRCALNYRKKFKTSELNVVLKKATAHVSIPTRKGNSVTIKYVTQTGTAPPTLALFANVPELVHFSYRRFLMNQFYMQLGLEGTPLVLRFRRKAMERNWDPTVREAGKPKHRWEKSEAAELAKGEQGAYYAPLYADDGSEFEQEFDPADMPDFELDDKYIAGDDDGAEMEVEYEDGGEDE